MNKKVLIVGTVPYNVRSTSRAFDAYFHFWKKESIAQIFSNPKKPCKGHCGTLYQITDHAMLERWFSKKKDVGVIYNYDELEEAWETNEYEISGAYKKAYKIGGKHSAFTHLMRGVLWKKIYWCTDKLNAWLDEFNPECVFLSFSDDYFINQIALYVSQRYNIPIVSCISDDYYFIKKFSINPIYYIYISTYRSLIKKVLSVKGSAVYISDKIKKKYNTEFNLDGETVYLTSTVDRRDFQPINKKAPVITYFGNVRIGRNKSLCDIADALRSINSEYMLEVYTNEQDLKYTEMLKNNPNIIFGGSIPYEKVQMRMSESDITVIVEGFEKKDVDVSRYSLSTKAADALKSGSAILAYGSDECGIIEYIKSTNAAMVCTDKESLRSSILNLLNNENLQRQNYDMAIEVTNKNHTLKRSCSIVEELIERAVSKG